MVEDISKIKLVRKRRWLHLLCLFFIWFSFLTKEEFFSHCLVDQENRIIVADLGETYIAQDLVIKSEDDDFYIDTSHYYVIAASGENVRVVFKPRAEIKPLQYFE